VFSIKIIFLGILTSSVLKFTLHLVNLMQDELILSIHTAVELKFLVFLSHQIHVCRLSLYFIKLNIQIMRWRLFFMLNHWQLSLILN